MFASLASSTEEATLSTFDDFDCRSAESSAFSAILLTFSAIVAAFSAIDDCCNIRNAARVCRSFAALITTRAHA